MIIEPIIQATSDTTMLRGYLGPGAGVGSLGALLALAGVVALMIVGFVWYPVKVILAKLRSKRDPEQPEGQTEKPDTL